MPHTGVRRAWVFGIAPCCCSASPAPSATPSRSCTTTPSSSPTPPAPFVPEEYHLETGYALLIAGFGSAEEHAKLLAPVREALPPACELVTPIPYTGLQSMLDESAPWGALAYEKSLYLDDLTDPVVDVVTSQTPNKLSPLSFIPIFDLGGQESGAYGKVSEDATAFGGSRAAR
jgi:hypothetical protein